MNELEELEALAKKILGNEADARKRFPGSSEEFDAEMETLASRIEALRAAPNQTPAPGLPQYEAAPQPAAPAAPAAASGNYDPYGTQAGMSAKPTDPIDLIEDPMLRGAAGSLRTQETREKRTIDGELVGRSDPRFQQAEQVVKGGGWDPTDANSASGKSGLGAPPVVYGSGLSALTPGLWSEPTPERAGKFMADAIRARGGSEYEAQQAETAPEGSDAYKAASDLLWQQESRKAEAEGRSLTRYNYAGGHGAPDQYGYPTNSTGDDIALYASKAAQGGKALLAGVGKTASLGILPRVFDDPIGSALAAQSIPGTPMWMADQLGLVPKPAPEVVKKASESVGLGAGEYQRLLDENPTAGMAGEIGGYFLGAGPMSMASRAMPATAASRAIPGMQAANAAASYAPAAMMGRAAIGATDAALPKAVTAAARMTPEAASLAGPAAQAARYGANALREGTAGALGNVGIGAALDASQGKQFSTDDALLMMLLGGGFGAGAGVVGAGAQGLASKIAAGDQEFSSNLGNLRAAGGDLSWTGAPTPSPDVKRAEVEAILRNKELTAKGGVAQPLREQMVESSVPKISEAALLEDAAQMARQESEKGLALASPAAGESKQQSDFVFGLLEEARKMHSGELSGMKRSVDQEFVKRLPEFADTSLVSDSGEDAASYVGKLLAQRRTATPGATPAPPQASPSYEFQEVAPPPMVAPVAEPPMAEPLATEPFPFPSPFPPAPKEPPMVAPKSQLEQYLELTQAPPPPTGTRRVLPPEPPMVPEAIPEPTGAKPPPTKTGERMRGDSGSEFMVLESGQLGDMFPALAGKATNTNELSALMKELQTSDPELANRIWSELRLRVEPKSFTLRGMEKLKTDIHEGAQVAKARGASDAPEFYRQAIERLPAALEQYGIQAPGVFKHVPGDTSRSASTGFEAVTRQHQAEIEALRAARAQIGLPEVLPTAGAAQSADAPLIPRLTEPQMQGFRGAYDDLGVNPRTTSEMRRLAGTSRDKEAAEREIRIIEQLNIIEKLREAGVGDPGVMKAVGAMLGGRIGGKLLATGSRAAGSASYGDRFSRAAFPLLEAAGRESYALPETMTRAAQPFASLQLRGNPARIPSVAVRANREREKRAQKKK